MLKGLRVNYRIPGGWNPQQTDFRLVVASSFMVVQDFFTSGAGLVATRKNKVENDSDKGRQRKRNKLYNRTILWYCLVRTRFIVPPHQRMAKEWSGLETRKHKFSDYIHCQAYE